MKRSRLTIGFLVLSVWGTATCVTTLFYGTALWWLAIIGMLLGIVGIIGNTLVLVHDANL